MVYQSPAVTSILVALVPRVACATQSITPTSRCQGLNQTDAQHSPTNPQNIAYGTHHQHTHTRKTHTSTHTNQRVGTQSVCRRCYKPCWLLYEATHCSIRCTLLSMS